MALKANFNSKDILRRGEIIEQYFDDYIFEVLSYVGEYFVKEARSINTYIDQTGNLRSSVGYIIVKNGSVKKENFEGSGEGKSKGMEVALSVGKDSRWVFIGVAGMLYAAAVESRGLDVITGSSEQARQLLISLLERAKQRIKK
jgi:hypothetical protein